MRAMETLVRRGLTRFIGVSNFDPHQMAQARAALTSERLACNQVDYHLRDRAIEADVLPWRAGWSTSARTRRLDFTLGPAEIRALERAF